MCEGRCRVVSRCCVALTSFVELLVEHKANVRLQTKTGVSPLHAAGGRFACLEVGPSLLLLLWLTAQQILIRAGAEVDVSNSSCRTPLAEAINCDQLDCAELLVDAGAKISSVHKDIKIPAWMNDIIAKRQNVRRSLLTFIGVLRRRFVVLDAPTASGNHVPRDMVDKLSLLVWETRFDSRWVLDVHQATEDGSMYADKTGTK